MSEAGSESDGETVRGRARRGIACAGCWTLDRIKLIDVWPAEEELAYVLGTDRQGGGSAHNVGIDLCKLDPDLPVEGIGLLGNDADGNYLVEQARTHGMQLEQLHRTSAAATAYTEVMTVTSTGRRTFFHSPGTNDLLTRAHVDLGSSNARLLHLGLLGVHALLDATAADGSNGWSGILQHAQALGIRTNIELVSIAAQRNREICAPCLPFLDYLIVNDHEIGGLADRVTLNQGETDVDACISAAREVLSQGAMHLVVVHYPAGAIAVTRDGVQQQRAAVAIDPALIEGAVGAGDAFAAGMLYALHEDWSLDDGLQLAHAVAAASLRSATTVGSVDTIEACLAFAAQQIGPGNPRN